MAFTTLANENEDMIFIVVSMNGKTNSIQVNKNFTVGLLKEEIRSQMGLSPESQEIWFEGTNLSTQSSDDSLDELGISDGSTITLRVIQQQSGAAAASGNGRDESVSEDDDEEEEKKRPTSSGGGESRAMQGGSRQSSQQQRRPASGGGAQGSRPQRVLRGGQLQANPIPKPHVANYLKNQSLLYCRILLVFVEICLILFIVNWGYWGMIYYLLAMVFAGVGWYGCRHLSSKYIFFFCVFLFFDCILMLDSLIYSAEHKEDHGYGSVALFIFLLVVEMILIGGLLVFLVRFALTIHRAKMDSIKTVQAAQKETNEMVICV